MAAKKTTTPVTPAEDKAKALEAALSQIEKQYGKGAVMKLGEKTDTQIEAYPTGSLYRSRREGAIYT